MYFTAIRPDIMYVVSLVSRFMETPKETHWQAAKRILRYVNGTKQYGVLYTTTSILVWLVTLTVIRWEVSMIERSRQDIFFIWVLDPFHGLQEEENSVTLNNRS